MERSNHPPIADHMLSTDGKGTLLKDYSFCCQKINSMALFCLSVKANMKPLIPWTVISVPSGQSFVELCNLEGLRSMQVNCRELYSSTVYGGTNQGQPCSC